jgi:hypothetical protein
MIKSAIINTSTPLAIALSSEACQHYNLWDTKKYSMQHSVYNHADVNKLPLGGWLVLKIIPNQAPCFVLEQTPNKYYTKYFQLN